jgi:hypothetical protein
VRNGAVAVPGLESLPLVEAYLVHDGAACATGAELIVAIAAATRNETNVCPSARSPLHHVNATRRTVDERRAMSNPHAV